MAHFGSASLVEAHLMKGAAGPMAFRLGPRGLRLWQVPLDRSPSEVAALRSMLSSDEIERADRFHFARDRRRFIVCRGTLRLLLGACMERDPGELRFTYGTFGKPALILEPDRSHLEFNLAHSNGWALIALSSAGPIGVDFEYVRRSVNGARIAELFLTDGEQERLQRLPEAKRHFEFFRLWTRREALGKARGSGWAASLEESAADWLYEWAPRPGYVAALAGHSTSQRTTP